MISQMVSSMLSMPPRESSRSTSGMPESIEKPLAIASQTALSDSTTTWPLPATKSAYTSGWRNAPRTPAKSVAASSARDAGTFRIDRKASSTSGSSASGVML